MHSLHTKRFVTKKTNMLSFCCALSMASIFDYFFNLRWKKSFKLEGPFCVFPPFFKDKAGPIRPALTDTASRLWWHIRRCKDSWVQICVFAFPSVFIAFNHSPLSACTLPLMRHKMVLLSGMPTLERLFLKQYSGGGHFRSGVFMHAASLAFRRKGFNSSIK